MLEHREVDDQGRQVFQENRPPQEQTPEEFQADGVEEDARRRQSGSQAPLVSPLPDMGIFFSLLGSMFVRPGKT